MSPAAQLARIRVLEWLKGVRAAARRLGLPTRTAAALVTAAEREFAALCPPSIDRRTADRLARRGLMRVEWCAVLTADGARAARSLAAQSTSRPVGARAVRPAVETGQGNG